MRKSAVIGVPLLWANAYHSWDASATCLWLIEISRLRCADRTSPVSNHVTLALIHLVSESSARRHDQGQEDPEGAVWRGHFASGGRFS